MSEGARPSGPTSGCTEGTLILTSTGERPVESLRPGDLLPVLFGQCLAPVLRLVTIRLDSQARPRESPVRIGHGAFPGGPHRDLLVGPSHCVLVAGLLVPARLLANGQAIRRDAVAPAYYVGIVLGQHDCVLAEGLAVESWHACEQPPLPGRQDGSAHFGSTADPGGVLPGRSAAFCAKLATSGAALRLARQHIAPV